MAYVPSFIQNFQRNLNSWIPEVPEDAVLGCAKSALASFTVSILITKGNVFAGLKAGIVAYVASVVHTVVLTVIAKAISLYRVVLTVETWSYISHGVTLFSLFSSYLYGRKWGMSLFWTLPLTALPYMITELQLRDRLSTPLFVSLIR